jgi:hypothetical protein
MAARNNITAQQVLQGEFSAGFEISTDILGLHIYMGGVGIQQCFILMFSVLPSSSIVQSFNKFVKERKSA